MKLPFLKNRKIPRIQKEPNEEVLVNAGPDDHLYDHCAKEMMDAVSSRDAKSFRKAIEALVLNMFDFDGDKDATNEG